MRTRFPIAFLMRRVFVIRVLISSMMMELYFERRKYPKETIVCLLKMEDDPFPVPVGTFGVVNGVDDTGSLLISWQNGRSLNVLYGIDLVEVVE